MAGPEGAVQPREPEVHCQPCGWDSLEPGESLHKQLEWDGRVWDPDDGRLRDAPPGRYEWTVTFTASHSEERACSGDGTASHTVEVDVG